MFPPLNDRNCRSRNGDIDSRPERIDGTITSAPNRGFAIQASFLQYENHYDMQQPIIGYHQDECGDWVADLACGHGQHVRHQPPFTNRPWVLTVAGREQRLGTPLNCKKCDEPADSPSTSG